MAAEVDRWRVACAEIQGAYATMKARYHDRLYRRNRCIKHLELDISRIRTERDVARAALRDAMRFTGHVPQEAMREWHAALGPVTPAEGG